MSMEEVLLRPENEKWKFHRMKGVVGGRGGSCGGFGRVLDLPYDGLVSLRAWSGVLCIERVPTAVPRL